MIWGKGATTIGYQHPTLDRVRCDNCHDWAKYPAVYELDRILCENCQEQR